MPVWLAILVTFAVSGALHDLAVMLVKWRGLFFFTPWFTLMGIWVVLSQQVGITYQRQPFVIRALLNGATVATTLWLATLLESLYTA